MFLVAGLDRRAGMFVCEVESQKLIDMLKIELGIGVRFYGVASGGCTGSGLNLQFFEGKRRAHSEV